MKTTYIVTGGTGFLGGHIVRQLTDRGERVIILARCHEKLAKTLPETTATVVYGTIMKPHDIEVLFERADERATLERRASAGEAEDQRGVKCDDSRNRILMIHTASVVYLGGNKDDLHHMRDTNIEGTKNIIDACLKHGARMVYISSVHAIPELPNFEQITEVTEFDPERVHGHYAKSKAEATKAVMYATVMRGLDAVVVHPSGITGPGDPSNTHLTRMVEDFKKGKIPAAVDGGYDFVDVRDVATGTIAAADLAKSGECFILSGGYYTVRQVLDTLAELGAGRSPRMTVPLWTAKAGLPFLMCGYAIRGKKPLFSRYSLYTLGSNGNFSHQKATDQLDYHPRSLKDSLRDML